MKSKGTLILKRSDVASLLNFDEYFESVESAFRSYGRGETLPQGLLHFESPVGEFHIKGGGLKLERPHFSLKNNGGFPQNPKQYGLPSIFRHNNAQPNSAYYMLPPEALCRSIRNRESWVGLVIYD
jgi:ornithine cyclodeaminase/alanine dehydrogenase-like protein (mu-crystallin family)